MPNELFLVDTSVWIFALRKKPVVQIKDRIDSLLKEDTVITTGIIKLEILAAAVPLHADAHFDLMEKPLGLRNESYVQVLKKALS